MNSWILLTSSCLYFIAKFPPSSVDILKCKVSLRTNRLKPLKSQDLTLTKSLLKSSHPPTQLYFTTSLFLINVFKILPSSVAILAKINKAAWKETQKVLNVPWSMAKWNFRPCLLWSKCKSLFKMSFKCFLFSTKDTECHKSLWLKMYHTQNYVMFLLTFLSFIGFFLF